MDGHRGRTIVAALTVAALVASGCSGGDEGATDATGTSASTATPGPGPDATRTTTGDVATSSARRDAQPTTQAPTTKAAPAIEVDGVSDPVAMLVRDLYGGNRVAASKEVRRALADADRPGRKLSVTGAQGRWRGEDIAVLTAGDDITLAVGRDREWRVVGGVWPSLGIDEPALGGARHILMIGSDAREKQGQKPENLRADSLQVLGVDGDGGGGVMGIARDAWVDMPRGGKAKINNAMVQAGPEGQVETVEAVTGLPIEGYVLVGFEGFMAFVDDWGGVTIDAPRSFLEYPEGVQELSGYWLLRWSRHRKTLPGGDFDRSYHQGIALTGMGLQARAEGPKGMPDILAMVEKHMTSDLDAEQVLIFAAWAYLADPGDFGHAVAKGGFGWSRDGQSIVLLDDAARDTFADFEDGNLD